ncbi:MAG: hypothetical protein EBY20_04130 [Alphaproteobacteria bacterium]|nr:hypothetical protein [Alphaproteobacteria bacterium]NDE19413.1 hypothetical protein [Alphaproteobacteria bacterium]
MNDNLMPKNAEKFYCKCCDFKCSKKSNFDTHLLTRKHITNDAIMTNEDKKISTGYCCDNCGKEYKHRQGLWTHSKKCQKTPKNAEHEDVKNNTQLQVTTDMSSNIIMELLKQNHEFKELLVDQQKQLCEQNKMQMEMQMETNKMQMETNKMHMEMQMENNKMHMESNKYVMDKMVDLAGKGGSYNTNCHNKTFNLQVFLNEQCKDALNITDFVNQIKLQLSDLDMIGRVGYTEGMSKIIIRNLKELDISKRPIHCSDLKREVMYVKDKDAWEKENGENVKIKNAIKFIEHKNVKQLPQWKAANPESDDYDSQRHMDYHKIIIESMGGATNEDDNKKREKIIKNIAKEVVIDRK